MFEGLVGVFAILVGLSPFLIVAGAVYLFLHKRGESIEIDWVGIYFQIASFLLLVVVWWSFADLSRLFFERLVGFPEAGSSSYGGDYYREGTFKAHPSDLERFSRQLSVRVSALLVALPLFLYHYLQAGRRGVHKTYYAVITFLSGGATVVTLVLFVRMVVEVLVGLRLDHELMSQALPYLLASGAIWIYHFRLFKNEGRLKAQGSQSLPQVRGADKPQVPVAPPPAS